MERRIEIERIERSVIKRSGRLDCGCNFSRDKCGVSNKEGREIGMVLHFTGSLGEI